MSTRKTGTHEWAEKTVNCIAGCVHDCVYCYARHNAVDRWRRMTAEEWRTPRVRQAEVTKRRPKYKGVVMFPSTHDITPEFLNPCMTVLENLVAAGNDVLVVTKPYLECVTAICGERKWRDHITFRFTIGGIDTLQFWEPGAPSFSERKDAMRYACGEGWRTSVSAEPLLEPWHASALYGILSPYLTGEFWVGKLNQAERRIKTTNIDISTLLLPRLLQWQTDERVMTIVTALMHRRGIQWKDSYKEVIARVAANGSAPGGGQ